ncbi:MAG: hypothetical protein GY711_13185 [bacterium]|nr:hypothetical protein [bacterium]
MNPRAFAALVTVLAVALTAVLVRPGADPLEPMQAPLASPPLPAPDPGAATERSENAVERLTAAASEVGPVETARLPVVAPPAVSSDAERTADSLARIPVILRTSLGQHPRAKLRELDRHQATVLKLVATRERPPGLFEPDDARPLPDELARYVPMRGEGSEGTEHGMLELHADLPLYVSVVLHHAVLDWQLVLPGTESIEFVLPTQTLDALATVRMKVVSATNGEPLSVKVQVRTGIASTSLIRIAAPGKIVVSDLPPGASQIEIVAHQHATHRQLVRLQPLEELDLGTIALEPEPRVFVRLTGGSPRPGQRLEFWPVSEGVGASRTTASRQGGLCHFRAQTSGPYVVRAVQTGRLINAVPHGSQAVEIDPRGRLESTFELALEPTTRVTLPSLGAAHTVRIHDASGRAIQELPLTTSPSDVELVRGAYEVAFLTGDDQELGRETFLVEASPIVLEPVP